MKQRLSLILLLAAVTLSGMAQTIGDAFYIYRNDGQFNAFFRDEILSIEYSYEDAEGITYDEIVTQIVNTADSVYKIPLAAIDSVAFGVNELKISPAYVPVPSDGYVVEQADTLDGIYLLRFLGEVPQLKNDDVISIVNDSLVLQVRIASLSFPDEKRVLIHGKQVPLTDIFVSGTFTLSTEKEPSAPSRRANVFYPEEIIYYDENNQSRRIRRADTEFTERLYSQSIDYSGTDIHKTSNTRLYLETCRFDFNLDLVMSCNFSGVDEAYEKFQQGKLALYKSVIRGSVDTDFMLRFDASAKKKFDGEEVMLKKNLHKPIDAIFVVAGVYVNVELTTHLLMDCTYDVEGSFSAYTGFATNNMAELGFSWTQASGLAPYSNYESSFTFHKPTIEGQAHLETKVTVFPRLTFSLYKLVGPSFDIKPYLRPELDLGFYDVMGSNKKDYYGAKCNIFTGYDAAVGLTFLSFLGNKPAVQSKPWNVVDKMIVESPKEIKFEEADSETLTPEQPMKVSFHVTEYDYIFNRSLNAELPFAVKFETNSGTLSSDFALVDINTGLATIEWTPAKESNDGKDAYIVAMMHDHNGKVITADRWTPKKGETSCPDSNHPHWIDLGLPSGTKWACCNVGASKPEDYGGYYAWGETQTKSIYNWDTYQCGRDWDDVDYIGSDISGTQYDAATVNWGAPWKMPTKAQCEELIENTTSKWTTHNGVKGRTFTSKKNGRTIFLPAAGKRGYELNFAGSVGDYWSSSLLESLQGCAWTLGFGSVDRVATNYYGLDSRNCGLSVRPVR